jgi:hypothetical protein
MLHLVVGNYAGRRDGMWQIAGRDTSDHLPSTVAMSFFHYIAALRMRRDGASAYQLWLIYFGYGVIGGIGLGLGYISPVSTLIKWFRHGEHPVIG